MEKIKAIKCNKCNSVFISGNNADGLPNGVGFELEDGRLINLCHNCIMELGKIKAAGDSVGVNNFFAELGIEPKESEGE